VTTGPTLGGRPVATEGQEEAVDDAPDEAVPVDEPDGEEPEAVDPAPVPPDPDAEDDEESEALSEEPDEPLDPLGTVLPDRESVR
jgi:hypothetical protein